MFSNGFKIVLSTLSTVSGLIFSYIFGLSAFFSLGFGVCDNLVCLGNLVSALLMGPINLFFYICFLKTKRDLFFKLSLIAILNLIIYFSMPFFNKSHSVDSQPRSFLQIVL